MNSNTNTHLLTIMLINSTITDNDFINNALLGKEDFSNDFIDYKIIAGNCFRLLPYKEEIESYSLFSEGTESTLRDRLKNKISFNPYAIAYCSKYINNFQSSKLIKGIFNKAQVKIKYNSIKDKGTTIDIIISLKDFLILNFINNIRYNNYINELQNSHLNETNIAKDIINSNVKPFNAYNNSTLVINEMQKIILPHIDNKDMYFVLSNYFKGTLLDHNYCTEKNWHIYLLEFESLKNFSEKIEFLKHNSFFRNSVSDESIFTPILKNLVSSIVYSEEIFQLEKVLKTNFLETNKEFKKILLKSQKYSVISEKNPFIKKEDFLLLNDNDKNEFLSHSSSLEYLCSVSGKELFTIVPSSHHELLLNKLLSLKNSANDDVIINLLLDNSNLDLKIFEKFETGKEKENLLLKLLKNKQSKTLLSLIEKGVNVKIDSPLLAYAKKFDKYKDIASELQSHILKIKLSNDLTLKNYTRKNKI